MVWLQAQFTPSGMLSLLQEADTLRNWALWRRPLRRLGRRLLRRGPVGVLAGGHGALGPWG